MSRRRRETGGREGAAGSFFSRSNHIGRSDDGGRRKARARAHSLSLSGALLVVRPSDVRPLPGALSLLGLSLSLCLPLRPQQLFSRVQAPFLSSFLPSPSICFPFREERGEWGLAPRKRERGREEGKEEEVTFNNKSPPLPLSPLYRANRRGAACHDVRRRWRA